MPRKLARSTKFVMLARLDVVGGGPPDEGQLHEEHQGAQATSRHGLSSEVKTWARAFRPGLEPDGGGRRGRGHQAR